jgi:hypothetical protein
MKKVFIFGGLIVALTVAGSAFALLAGGESKSGPTASASSLAALVPESVEEGNEVAAATEAPRKCGSQASRCGSSTSGAGCCGGSSAATDIGLLKTQLQAYYSKSIDGEITVEVKDLGCHQEAEIRQDNRVIKRISISGREITELT